MSEDVSVNAATPEQVIDWVQLMSAIPADTNPLNDPNGQWAEQGDTGKTHYLAGTMGGAAQRTFEVDLGDTLVLPMINVWEWVVGDYGTLQNAARGFFEGANPQKTWLKIDLNNDSKKDSDFEFNFNLKKSTYFPELSNPKQTGEFYVESESDFEFYNPENNINGLVEGNYDAYAVGYWAQIENLPEGTHKIKFGGIFDPESFDPIKISVTDIITVVDCSNDYPM